MMKKINPLKLLLFFCLATLFFSSCEKELYEEPLRKKVKYVTINEVPFLMPSIIEYNKHYKDYSLQSRDAEGSIDDLDLNLDKILQYEVDGKITYSIIINKEFTEYEDKYFENLHLYYDETNDIKSLILKYNSVNDDIPFDIKNFSGLIELFDIDKNLVSYTTYENGNKVHLKFTGYLDCLVFFVYSDGDVVVWDNCPTSSGGGTATGTGTGAGTGSTGGGGVVDNPPTDETPSEILPNVPDEIDEDPNSPCATLKKKTNETAFKNRFSTLNVPANYALDHETGFAESRDAVGGNITYHTLTSAPGTHALDIPPLLNCVSFTHIHNNDYINEYGTLQQTIKNFSPADLYYLATTAQNNAYMLEVPMSETYGMMLSSEGIFALKMLAPITNADNIDWIKFNDEYKLKAKQLAENENLNNVSAKKLLLQMMKDYNVYDKIALYEASFLPSMPNSPIWKRVTLDGKKLNYSPC